ncbi:hypothetical protein CY34DRAFT_469646 [Suillus luteus UH-Slu-Lm8-n1]|uniref:Uncharacterized protein n=1 Tax=Suillus luteus UH-Slu-Lm8-n1 TaxID=930992 RepID=A0A0D0ASJ5_9AGAM|nr:hypothetical protein CY34DRAFT_469646 [Suillus luteus UH-Slu-Lm8-n1]
MLEGKNTSLTHRLVMFATSREISQLRCCCLQNFMRLFHNTNISRYCFSAEASTGLSMTLRVKSGTLGSDTLEIATYSGRHDDALPKFTHILLVAASSTICSSRFPGVQRLGLCLVACYGIIHSFVFLWAPLYTMALSELFGFYIVCATRVDPHGQSNNTELR